MEYAVLGRTGLQVSRVGFGGGGIGQVWGPTTEAESVRAIHRALELGVNFSRNFSRFVEEGTWEQWAREGLAEACVFPGDPPRNGEERHRAATRWDARQRVRNGATHQGREASMSSTCQSGLARENGQRAGNIFPKKRSWTCGRHAARLSGRQADVESVWPLIPAAQARSPGPWRRAWGLPV
jgi:hypothetical protein